MVNAVIIVLTGAFFFSSFIIFSPVYAEAVPSFSTFLGGVAQDSIRDVTIDSSGNMYVTGGTQSHDFPVTSGAYDTVYNTGSCASVGSGGPMDVFVRKFSPSGQLVWSTFLGGPCYDRAYAIEVDPQGFVYVGGRAGDQFPTTAGLIQQFTGEANPNTLYGQQDGFIAKLTPDGSGVVWSTYFGGPDQSFFRDIDIDGSGNAYGIMTAVTQANPRITTSAYDNTHNGNEDLVLTRFSPQGQFVWGTYIGSSDADGGGPAVRVGATGVYIQGGSRSSLIPGFSNQNAGGEDFIIGKFSFSGQFQWGTFHGGTGDESTETHGLMVDAQDNIYVAGVTHSANYPTTVGVVQQANPGGWNIPLAKFSSAGQMIASTYLGGSGGEGAQGIASDPQGNVVVFGGTNSQSIAGHVLPVSGTTFDFLTAKLTPDLSNILFIQTIGSTGSDDGRTGWVGSDGAMVVAGMTNSPNFPIYNAFQSVHGGDYDGAIVRYSQTSNPSVTPTVTATPIPTGTLKAFPGAEGFGAHAAGGRGGRVIEVTNLDDSGIGSLRSCIEASGPRTCVFRVAGTIEVHSQMNITNPYITVAGQTAPGDGITLKAAMTGNNTEGPLVIKTHDVIIRYIRSRPGPGLTSSSCCLSGIRILGGSSIILDHISASWAVDDNLTHWFAQSDITVSWSILSEALSNSTHSGGEHSKGYLIGDHAKKISVHHNLFSSNVDRNPLWKGDTTGEFINNVVYNWSKAGPKNGSTHLNDSDTSGPSFVNIIGNHYSTGPSTPAGYKAITIGSATASEDVNAATKVYAAGNIGPGRPTNSGDDWLLVEDYGSTDDINSPHRSNSLALPASGVTVADVSQVMNAVIADAGANKRLSSTGAFVVRRDSVDTRVIAGVQNGTGAIIDNPSSVGGWPVLSAGTAYADSDRDGMSDEWEQMYFGSLARGSAQDSSSDADADGYTDLEEFLNGTKPLSNIPSPTPTGSLGCTLTGDIDCNNTVNIFDLSRLLTVFGQSVTTREDINGDGAVTIFDLSILLSNFGT